MIAFFEIYSSYSNYELLKITKRPENYQPEAVRVAEKLLASRVISEDETNQVEKYYQEIDYQKKITQEKRESIYKNLNAHFNVFANTNNILDVEKWLNIYIIFILATLLFSTFMIFYGIYNAKESDILDFKYYLIGYFIQTLFTLFLVFLLYKRKRLGWILVVVSSFFSLSIILIKIVLLINFSGLFFLQNSYSLLWSIVINIATVLFFWKNEVAELFVISSKQKIKYYANIIIVAFLVTMFALLIFIKLYDVFFT